MVYLALVGESWQLLTAVHDEGVCLRPCDYSHKVMPELIQ